MRFVVRLISAKAQFDTGYIAQHHDELGLGQSGVDAACGCTWSFASAVACRSSESATKRTFAIAVDIADGFQLSGPRKTTLPILVNGEPDVAVLDYAGGIQRVTVHGAEADMAGAHWWARGAVYVRRAWTTDTRRAQGLRGGARTIMASSDGIIRAPMHGKLLAILVARRARR